MGMQDRDWYREEVAEKNGMRYNKKNATYSAAEKVVASSVRNAEFHRSVPIGSDWHWSLKLLLWLVIIVLVTGFVSFVNYLAR